MGTACINFYGYPNAMYYRSKLQLQFSSVKDFLNLFCMWVIMIITLHFYIV